jgi:hypothetical protein
MTITQDHYVEYYTEKLWQLVPEVYRTEDGQGQGPGALRDIVRTIAEQAAVSRRSIDRLWEDQHIETCDDWAVPYIGDLLSSRPVSEHDARARRVNVARTIFYRRRRGTPNLLERLVRELSGWDVVLVEAFRRLARTRHRLDVAPAHVGLFTQTPTGGTADLRSARSAELVDTPFEEYYRTPDVRRLRGLDGRFNIRKLNFHLYRLNTYVITGADPAQLGNGVTSVIYTFDPSGRDVPLFARGVEDVDDKNCANPFEWEVKKPIPCRLLGHAEYRLTAGTLDLIEQQAADESFTPPPADVEKIVGERFSTGGRYTRSGLPHSPGRLPTLRLPIPPAYHRRLLLRRFGLPIPSHRLSCQRWRDCPQRRRRPRRRRDASSRLPRCWSTLRRGAMGGGAATPGNASPQRISNGGPGARSLHAVVDHDRRRVVPGRGARAHQLLAEEPPHSVSEGLFRRAVAL